MQISVLAEPVNDNGYRAQGAEPFAVSAEGPAREEALAKLKAKVEARLRAGAEVVTIQVGPAAHPWLPFAGMFKDDPEFKKVLKIIASNRRKMDKDNSIR